MTHCRFEARAVYGITKVLVVDFDEFLYCPSGNPNALTQRSFIREYVNEKVQRNIHQVTFLQKVIANVTDSPRDCMIEKARHNRSVLECYSSLNYIVGTHSVKSFHLGYHCPVTGIFFL